MYLVVWWLSSHTGIKTNGQGSTLTWNILKAGQGFSSVQTDVRAGCGLLPSGFLSYNLLQPHSHLHWALCTFLQSRHFTEVCIPFFFFFFPLQSETSESRKAVLLQKRTAARSWKAAGAGSRVAWPLWQGLATAGCLRKKAKLLMHHFRFPPFLSGYCHSSPASPIATLPQFAHPVPLPFSTSQRHHSIQSFSTSPMILKMPFTIV